MMTHCKKGTPTNQENTGNLQILRKDVQENRSLDISKLKSPTDLNDDRYYWENYLRELNERIENGELKP